MASPSTFLPFARKAPSEPPGCSVSRHAHAASANAAPSRSLPSHAISLHNTSVVIPLPVSMPLPRLIVTLSPSTDVHLAVNACSIIPLVRVHSGPLSPSGPHDGSLRVQPSAITTSLGRRTALITSSHSLMSRARTSSSCLVRGTSAASALCLQRPRHTANIRRYRTDGGDHGDSPPQSGGNCRYIS